MGTNKRYPDLADRRRDERLAREATHREWHPLLTAREFDPGHWVMEDGFGHPYAFICFVKRGGEVGYRLSTWAQSSEQQKVLGYYRTLRGAAKRGYELWINRNVPGGPPNTPKGYEDPWGDYLR